MNNLQIEMLMSEYNKNDIFKGVYPADRLPVIRHKQSGYIVNTDTSNEPGQHWVAFYFPLNGLPEYFDSYGMIPLNGHFYKFLGNTPFLYNNILLQSPFSATCGQYCIYFLTERLKGKPFKSIISEFNQQDTHFNDALVKKYIYSNFKSEIKIYDQEFLGRQISKIFKPYV